MVDEIRVAQAKTSQPIKGWLDSPPFGCIHFVNSLASHRVLDNREIWTNRMHHDNS